MGIFPTTWFVKVSFCMASLLEGEPRKEKQLVRRLFGGLQTSAFCRDRDKVVHLILVSGKGEKVKTIPKEYVSGHQKLK